MLLRMPAHRFHIPRVGEHTFQMIDHWVATATMNLKKTGNCNGGKKAAQEMKG
jgi:hypothetical protein